MEKSLEEYMSFLDRYAAFLEEMARAEKEKYRSLLSFDAGRLSESISELQSHLMQLDNMEAKRMELQRSAEFGEQTFKQMLASAPPEERGQLEELFQRIQLAVCDVKFLNEKALTFARESLAAFNGESAVGENNLYAPPSKGKAGRSAEGAAVFEAQY